MHSNASMPVSANSYMNQLLAIIDSRLQFISFKMKDFSNLDLDSDLGSSRSDSFRFIQQTDLTFQFIERLTHQKSRLLTLRKYMNAENVNIAYDLLQKDYYLRFSIDDLRNRLMCIPDYILDNQVPRASSAA